MCCSDPDVAFSSDSDYVQDPPLPLHYGHYRCSSLSTILSSLNFYKANMSAQRHKILILGGGIAGLATALSLIRFSPPHLRPKIDVFEIRPQPGTIGGAMSLASHGLRVLDHLGVYDVIKRRNYGIEVNAMEFFSIYHRMRLAKLDFRGPNDEGIGKLPYKVSLDCFARNITDNLRGASHHSSTVDRGISGSIGRHHRRHFSFRHASNKH